MNQIKNMRTNNDKKAVQQKSAFRLSLGARVFLSTSFLLIAALATIVVITLQTGKDVAEKSVKESIQNSLALQNYFRDQ